DAYYMTVCQLLTGTGGWPLTIIMSPERKPFFAATYLPKESKYGRMGLMQLIPAISSAWKSARSDVIGSAEQISEHVRRAALHSSRSKEMYPGIIKRTYDALSAAYDQSNGGFGNAPKFPTAQNLLFLLRHHVQTGGTEPLSMVDHTLTSMRMGGIYDQIGFGFHRYSTDSQWRLPHFEKMLYDQALMSIVYTEAFQITGNNLFRRTVEEIITYVLRDMRSPDGVFYCAEDADSEGQEGKYYLWNESEIRKILSPVEHELVMRTFNIEKRGNYGDEVSHSRNGKNLLYRSQSEEQLAKVLGISSKEYSARLQTALSKMFIYRSRRIPPQKDTKILCDWNGLMIVALAKAGRLFDDENSTKAARKAADFIVSKMRSSGGYLYHRYIDGEAAISGFLDDYAFLIWGLIELYQTTFELNYLRLALELNERSAALFLDENHGAFFSSTNESELPRRKDALDAATPSGNAVMGYNLIKLGRITGHHELEDKASVVFDFFGEDIQKHPLGYVHMLISYMQQLSPAPNIVILADTHDSKTNEMLHAINTSRNLDATTLILSPDSDVVKIVVPQFARSFIALDGKTTAYFCRDYKCDKPTTDTKELARLLR
ncbi:MAG: thioredoxin domain-containing protein, partial [candidate division WOR-3 bacterium]